MESEYINIMIESLEKKNAILNQVIELNKQQKFLLQDPNLAPNEFEKNMQYKDELVKNLNLLDEGFEELYGRVREMLQANRQKYAGEIARMQELIREITEQINTVQIQELHNKENAARKFADVRQQVRGIRNSQKVVRQYYDNMMSSRNASMQIIDNKK